MDHGTGNQDRERELRAALIGYLHYVQSPPEEPAVERNEKASPRTPAITSRRAAAPLPQRPPAPLPQRPQAQPPTPSAKAQTLPQRTQTQSPAPPAVEDTGDVTIDLRDGERVGGIWQRPVEEPPAPSRSDPPLIAGSDRYAFSLAVGNSYCYACGHFAMHQIVLEARPTTRARRLGAYRCRCTLCEYLSSPRPSEIHRAEEYLASSNKRGAWTRARRAVGVGRVS
jgi:hypothetical protein